MMLNNVNHKNILIRILKDIYTDVTVGPYLGFKGGTAAYLFYNLNRFSVDLDFDLIDPSKEQHIYEKVKKIVEEYGIVKEAYEKRYTIFFRLAYEENHQNIKVEINRRDFGSKYEVKSYLGISMKVMIKEDMVAHKMVAMIERIGKANRDIFDTYFFLKNNWPINEQIIEQRTGLSMRNFLKKCINELGAMSNHRILDGLGELLDAKQKEWVKNKLRTETIFLLELKLTSLQALPQAFLYSYNDSKNLFDPSGKGSFYKEFRRGGIYNNTLIPASAVIAFSQQPNETFLDKFYKVINEKIRLWIIKKYDNEQLVAQDLAEFKSIKKGQTIQLSSNIRREEIQEIITQANDYFADY